VQLSVKVFPRPRATTTLAFAVPTRAAQLEALMRVNRGPVQVDALDLVADAVLVRIGGGAEALPARARRLSADIDADVRSSTARRTRSCGTTRPS
jgi:hypothetical protein